jgi:cytosine/adenosine deaminase-related metal-dependent hydrolase
VGVVFHEMLGSREQRTGDALADGHKELERLLAADGDGWPQGFSYVPAAHAPYSVSPALLRRIFDEARRLGQASSIHVAEDADELALLRDGSGPWAAILARMGVKEGERTSGLSPVAHLAAAGAFESSHPPLLVHMVHASAEDRRIAAAAHAPAVLCPRSNLHVGGRLPDVPALLRDGVVLALGTDSLASSPDLSLWGEMEALAAAFPNVAPEVWLAAATTGGANALGLADHGALAPGKRPGLLDVSGGDLGADAATVYHRLVAVHPRSCRFLSRAVATPSRSPARLS